MDILNCSDHYIYYSVDPRIVFHAVRVGFWPYVNAEIFWHNV